MSEMIDAHAVQWIVHSSLDDAKRYIRQASAATLRAADSKLEDAARRGRSVATYRKLIASRLRGISQGRKTRKASES